MIRSERWVPCTFYDEEIKPPKDGDGKYNLENGDLSKDHGNLMTFEKS